MSGCSMGATYSGLLLTRNGSPTKVEVLQIFQLGNRIWDGCERMTPGVAWVLQRAGFYLPSSDLQTARLSVWSADSSPISLGKAEMHDDDVTLCSMGATESGVLLTLESVARFQIQ